jgi:hypothetical protein
VLLDKEQGFLAATGSLRRHYEEWEAGGCRRW